MIKNRLILAVIIALSLKSFSQNNFYDVDNVREIKMYFTQPNWDYILDSLYVAGDQERLIASIEIDGDSYDSVGVRYKGFSSVSVNTIKNPFNIKLDYIDNNQNHEGFKKLKLSLRYLSFNNKLLSFYHSISFHTNEVHRWR